MPDKLTYTEIKKAMECLEKDINCGDCAVIKQCKGDCVFTKTLDLINRLQAEIERLQDNTLWEECKRLSAELMHAKSEAVKEFAERALKGGEG